MRSDYAMPVAWGPDDRDFWTRRKRTVSSLMTVLCLVAGIATAFKLFERTVPNNVVRDASTFEYEIWKRDANLGDTDFLNTGGCATTSQPGCTTTYGAQPIFDVSLGQYPGDTRTVEVRVDNTNIPARDATFKVYLDNIQIMGCVDGAGAPQSCENQTATIVSPNTVAWNAFVSYWTFSVDKELVLQAAGEEANEDDHNALDLDTDLNEDPDNTDYRRFEQSCSGGVLTIEASQPCTIGTIRAAGTEDVAGGRLDQRYFLFNVTEADDGTDQSAFKDWELNFTLVFQAQIPAIPEAPAPVSER